MGGSRDPKTIHKTGVEIGRVVGNCCWRLQTMRLILYAGGTTGQTVALVTWKTECISKGFMDLVRRYLAECGKCKVIPFSCLSERKGKLKMSWRRNFLMFKQFRENIRKLELAGFGKKKPHSQLLQPAKYFKNCTQCFMHSLKFYDNKS